MPKKMSEEAKAKLRKYPKVVRRCSICNTPRTYTNPVWKCDQCGKFFCFDHLHGGQVNDKMKENEEVKNICKECKMKYGYYKI